MSERQTRYQLGVGHYAFQAGFTFDLQGNLATLDYPDCLHSNDSCDQVSPPRQVSYAYDKGFLTAVPGFASSLSYQSGGMLTQISHQSGITETYQVDPSGLARPERISTNAGWDTGTFDYDGAGNIHRIGSLQYRYDRFQRLVSGEVKVGSNDRLQTASYDNFGNITQMITHGASQTMSPNSSTNRLGLSGTTYDAGGNLTRVRYSSSEIYEYTYDAANMMKHLQSNTDQASVYIYNADDERIVTFSCFSAAGSSCVSSPASETWTLRGMRNEVLRVFSHPRGESFEWKRDYVYRGGLLLASVDPDTNGVEGIYSFHLDHLGTPRQVTKSGSQVALHSYYPFGQEATTSSSDEFQLKFTGHERDQNGAGAKSELDYMHARHCSPVVGRFLSIDPVLQLRRAMTKPQTWNRYNYALNNPMAFSDPSGKDVSIQIVFDADLNLSDEFKQEIIENVREFWEGLDVGDVYVFDSAELNETNVALFNKGVGKILVNGDSGNASSTLVKAGQFISGFGLTKKQSAQAVANAINHEVFAHQFALSPYPRGDLTTFSLNRRQGVVPEVSERYGTVADSLAWADPRTRSAFVNGPIPIHSQDLKSAQRGLRSVRLSPPSGGSNRWWKSW